VSIQLQITDTDNAPVPDLAFDEIVFRPSIAHGGWDCKMVVNGLGSVENIRIKDLRIANVVAAMIEASKVLYAGAKDLPVNDFTMTVTRGNNGS
jgi:hypothetical protein